MSKSKAKSVFTIIYPNLETLMYVRGKYPKLEEMEVGTDIINETFIEVHYLKAKAKAGEVLKDLIYFGTLLIAANRFKPLNDHHNVFHCWSLPQKVEQTTQDQEATQVEAAESFGEYLKRVAEKQQVAEQEKPACHVRDHVVVTYEADVITFSYPLKKTLLADEGPNTFFSKFSSIADTVRDYVRLKYGTGSDLNFSTNAGKFEIAINDIHRLSFETGMDIESLSVALCRRISSIVVKPEYLP